MTDFAQIAGHEHAKRAIEIALAGAHNLILTGPPGCGKTMLLDAIEAAKESKVLRMDPDTTNATEIEGNRLLLLEDIHDWETTRANSVINTANRFAIPFFATQLPCLCGYAGHETKPCYCSEEQYSLVRNRTTRIRQSAQIHIVLSPITWNKLFNINAEPTAWMMRRIQDAWRFEAKHDTIPDKTKAPDIRSLDETGRDIMRAAYTQLNMTPKDAYDALAVARTIANLSLERNIQPHHVAEALQYRERPQ